VKHQKRTSCGNNADEGQGGEQGSRDGRRSVKNLCAIDRMPTNDRAISKAAEISGEASKAHVLWKEYRQRHIDDYRNGDDDRRSDRIACAVEGMSPRNMVMNRTAEIIRIKASEMHQLWKKCQPRPGRRAEQQGWQGIRPKLTGRDADEGPGDEQSNREGNDSIRHAPSDEKMPTKDRMMSRAAGMARETS
jgi:hypothetical protein